MSTQIKRIAVGIDFSESSDRALSEALDLARSLSASLELVYVYDIPMVAVPEMVLPAGTDASQLAELRRQLKQVRDETVRGQVPAQAHLRVGDPVAGILDVAKEEGCQLIIVGSHGRGAMMRALLGSVSERLCRRSPVPVLVVPAPARAKVVEQIHGVEEKEKTAWSCAKCGHIRGRTEATDRCRRCGAEPAEWTVAVVKPGPADTAEPAVGEGFDQSLSSVERSDPAQLFSTSPPGTEGYSVNPELRVRY